ncbi:MAG: TetR/AcrR family transcriptional regulator [Acidimicrobiales bacterium]
MTSTRERILDASAELFRRQGLTGTGIKQILARADAPFGSLYHHFPGGKGQLAAETIKRAGAYYAEVVTDRLLSESDLVAGVRSAFRGAGETLEATDYADACPIETVALEVASTNEPLRLATAEVFDSWLQGLTALLVHEGIAPDPARALAHTILCALEGAFILARTTRTTEALDACSEAMATLVESALAEAR